MTNKIKREGTTGTIYDQVEYRCPVCNYTRSSDPELIPKHEHVDEDDGLAYLYEFEPVVATKPTRRSAAAAAEI